MTFTVSQFKHNVLTNEQYNKSKMCENNQITVFTYFNNGIGVFFLADSFQFGIGVLPKNFVSICSSLIKHVAPRSGLEDGNIKNLQDFLFVFHSEDRQLNSIEELVEYLNNEYDDDLIPN